MIALLIQEIALRRGNLTNGPVIPAGMIIGSKLAVLIRGIGLNKFVTLVQAIDSS